MIRLIFILGLLTVSILGFGQKDFSSIDDKSKSIPDSLSTANEIALFLTHNLNSDTEKARAIYIWIAHNIKYDLSQINTTRRFDTSQELIDEVLKVRQGICQHYSELFHSMSKSVGLTSYLIRGYTRDAMGEIADVSHVWNGIEIDSNYYFIDATWAAGYELNGRYVHKFRDNYFLKSPQGYIKDHMPFDPIWQFLDNPINNNDFISNDFSKLDTYGDYSFKDSIRVYENSNKLSQLENTNRRIISCGINHDLIQKQIDENTLQITNAKYNLAIDTLNFGIDNYNLYITHKNKQFRNPKLEDSQVKEMIDNAGIGVYSANMIFENLISSNKELNNLISDAQERMPSLISDLEREKDFVVRYLEKWKPLRIFMFYQFTYF